MSEAPAPHQCCREMAQNRQTHTSSFSSCHLASDLDSTAQEGGRLVLHRVFSTAPLPCSWCVPCPNQCPAACSPGNGRAMNACGSRLQNAAVRPESRAEAAALLLLHNMQMHACRRLPCYSMAAPCSAIPSGVQASADQQRHSVMYRGTGTEPPPPKPQTWLPRCYNSLGAIQFNRPDTMPAGCSTQH